MRRPALARTAQKHRPPPILSRIGPAPLVAYSAARKLRTGYAGSALRVRRSTDDAEADIGFTASGLLDTAALLAHTGADSGYITTLYDQSGSANAVQATKANQPRIVNAGTIDTYGGRPCPRYRPAGTEFHFLASTVTINGTTCSVALVGALESNSAANGRFMSATKPATPDYDRVTSFLVARNASTQGLISYSPSTATASTTYGAASVISRVSNGTDDRPRLNGTLFTSAPVAHTASFDITVLRFGSTDSAADSLGGGIGDILVWSTALADFDRLAVERDLGAFYGVTVQ